MLLVIILFLHLFSLSCAIAMEEQVKHTIEKGSSIFIFIRPQFQSAMPEFLRDDDFRPTVAEKNKIRPNFWRIAAPQKFQEEAHVIGIDSSTSKNESSDLSQKEKREPKLFKLIRSRASHKKITREIEVSSSVNNEYSYTTPLNYAIHQGDAQLISLLISHGAWLNKKMSNVPLTPLRKAISISDDSMVLLLLSLGAEVNYGDSYDEMPLYEAIAQYHYCCSKEKEFAPQALSALVILLKSGAQIHWPSALTPNQKLEKEKFTRILEEVEPKLDL